MGRRRPVERLMCGITGILGGVGADDATLRRMMRAIQHRGPDDSGTWRDPEVGLGFGFVRLAILDLTAAGHQPMMSGSGRFVLVFNGEAYNHLELRTAMEREGKAPHWRGHSDTETVLAGFEVWGVLGTVSRVVGMFAFAVWDRERRELTLGRDRLGEKPLYYGFQRETLIFGSELAALRSYPGFARSVDRDALALLLRHNYVPAPYSIYQGISKLLPGTLLTLSPGQREVEPKPYWSIEEAVTAGLNDRFQGNERETVDELERQLSRAVRGQMLSDVPLGAFLSGGVDSSAVVSLMQEASARPVRTFTIGFQEEAFNEAEHARAVARHLGTDHTDLLLTAQQALEVIPSLPEGYSEPFADSSQIPTLLVSRLARQSVTVALSGDGGDELFGGYPRYDTTEQLWRRIRVVPTPLRRGMLPILRATPLAVWNGIAAVGCRKGSRGDQLLKGVELLGAGSMVELYRGLISLWQYPTDVVLDSREPPTRLDFPPTAELAVERLMALDAVSYLPDDILAKVDRAAMAVSLETRVPLLDHRVVEFAWRVPLSYKRRSGSTKWLLRQLLYRRVPPELIERPKSGFAVPISAWLRGPLRTWAEELLSEQRLRSEGFLQPALIRRCWSEHLSGRRNWQYQLWTVLMFQAWLARQ